MKGIPNQKLLVLGLGYVGKFQKLPTLDFHQSKPRFALSVIGNSQMYFFEKWWWTPWDRIRKKTHPTKTNPRKNPKNHLFPHPLGLVQFTYELTLKINHVGKIFQGGVKSVKSVQVDSMYPPVNELGNGNPPFPIKNTSSHGGFPLRC